MKLISSTPFSGRLPAYMDATLALRAVSDPAARVIRVSDGRVIACVEKVNNVALSEVGQVAWQGNDTGFLYLGERLYADPSTGKTPIQVFQHSFLFVGESLRYFPSSDKAAYEATSGWRRVDEATGRIVSINETTDDPARSHLHQFSPFPGFAIGQGPQDGDGICVALDGEDFLRQLVPGEWDEIKIRAYGTTLIMCAVSFKDLLSNVWELDSSELRERPRLVSRVTFFFNHPVLIVPYKDFAHEVPVRYRMDDGSLGVFSENVDPSNELAEAAQKNTRALIIHDGSDDWTLPQGLRPWDIPGIELYRLPSETVTQTAARNRRQMSKLLADWSGDVSVTAMFYRQQKPDSRDPSGWSELWSEAEVLEILEHLSEIVNMSPRIKVVAPFCWERANGIHFNGTIINPGLAQALVDLISAADQNVELVPVKQPVPVPTPTPIPVPKPVPTPVPIGDEDSMLMNNEQYEKAIQIAGDVAAKYLHNVSGATQDMCRQKAREATDRFKNAADVDKRNPTIQELADNAFVQFAGQVPDFSVLDAYTAECLMLDREFKEQEGLRRR